MKVYKLQQQNGADCFEIENFYISVRQVAARLLSTVRQVTGIKKRRLFSSPCDIHITFQYQGKLYMVWEPYADNSRYWIGPHFDEDGHADIQPLLQTFESYRPSLLWRLLFIVAVIWWFVMLLKQIVGC